MEIKTKLNVGQNAFFIHGSRVVEATVQLITIEAYKILRGSHKFMFRNPKNASSWQPSEHELAELVPAINVQYHFLRAYSGGSPVDTGGAVYNIRAVDEGYSLMLEEDLVFASKEDLIKSL